MLYPICGCSGRFENWSGDAAGSIEEAVDTAQTHYRSRHPIRNRYGSRSYRDVRHDVRSIRRICVVRGVHDTVPYRRVRCHR